MRTVQVIDPATGKAPDMDYILLTEEWARRFIYTIVKYFALDENDKLIVVDIDGYTLECPEGRFEMIPDKE